MKSYLFLLILLSQGACSKSPVQLGTEPLAPDSGSQISGDSQSAVDSDGGELVIPDSEEDLDKDGYPSESDCDDQDPEISPGAVEICDSVDNDCDQEIDESTRLVGS